MQTDRRVWRMLLLPPVGALALSAAITLLPPVRWLAWVIGPAIMASVIIYAAVAGSRLKIRQADPHTQALFGLGVTLAGAVLLITSGVWPGGWSGSIMPIEVLVLIGGVQVMVFALRTRRVGSSLHCPRCDYELGCIPEDAPDVCPECAEAWRNRWITGARTRSTPLAAAGALLCLIGVSPILLKVSGLPSGVMVLTPSTLLISTAATDPWGNNKATWGEIARRTFSQPETDRLASKLLDLRRASGYLYGPPAAWLEAAASAPSLSPAILKRYYDEWFEPEIDLPDDMHVGRSMEVFVLGEERRGGPNTWMFVWVHPVTVNGSALPRDPPPSGSGYWVHSLSLKRDLPMGMQHSPPPTPVWTPTTPGDHLVEAVIYRCVVPMGTMPPGATEADGSPSRPPTAVHFDRAVARKQVRVIAGD